MSELLSVPYYISVVVLGILPIMNPLSTIPLYLGLTANMTRPDAHRQDHHVGG